MNQIVLLLRNKTNVTELLSLELVTTSIIIVIKEHPYMPCIQEAMIHLMEYQDHVAASVEDIG